MRFRRLSGFWHGGEASGREHEMEAVTFIRVGEGVSSYSCKRIWQCSPL